MKPKGGTRSGGSVLDAVRRAASKDNSRVRTQGGDIRGGGGGGDGGLSARFAALSEKAGGRVTKESTPRVRKIITRDEIKKRDGKKGGKLSSKKKVSFRGYKTIVVGFSRSCRIPNLLFVWLFFFLWV
uniref:Uncharacterized protein n=1 Tax=Rhodosorus marinus TaxID=101924 RepID=A0A7S3EI75_9RHOD|mmetsp:Transcript_38020/g.151047  ORF Transcript_38020/g.151047 Transcript_38020/m.151047 type:complete len:128 (+) Transcript_38020:605-988(+)